MRTLVDIYDDMRDANKRRVHARRLRDPVAYASASRKLQDLDQELAFALNPSKYEEEASKRRQAAIRKTVKAHVEANTMLEIVSKLASTPRLRSSLDGVVQGALVQMRGAKPSKSFTGSRGRNRLERTPIKGKSPVDRHATPNRLKRIRTLEG